MILRWWRRWRCSLLGAREEEEEDEEEEDEEEMQLRDRV